MYVCICCELIAGHLFLNLLARFQLYKVKLFYLDQAKLFESWTNSMEGC